ncbi:MAG: tRNA lysidine(34) synthetase TilS [Saprospiraceae bacterium]
MKTSIHHSSLFQTIRKKLGDLGIKPTTRLLVGVSGGVDSMVLLTVLKELEYLPTAAHVNFQLRDKESDADAALVCTWCSDQNIQYLEFLADTKQYAAVNKLNTQSAAREIRYAWWKELVEKESFEWVATAHHQDDSIETFFLNVLRGTGIKGLRGIPTQRDYFIRPMIDISRNEIESFALTFHIPFRTDRSNDSDDYQRNRIRHHLIPLLRELNPDFNAVMMSEKKRIELEWEAWDTAYQSWQRDNLVPDAEGLNIKVEPAGRAFLLRWLEEKNIPWSLSYDFIASSHADTGKVMFYDNVRLSRTSDGFYYETSELFHPVLIDSPGIFQIGNHKLTIEVMPGNSFSMDTDPDVEFADLHDISWPLELTAIVAGDYFQPIGMKGKSKKIQDYLVDLKLEHHEKDKVRVLRSKEHIIWLVGKRLDERVKVNTRAKEIYKLSFK